MEICQESDETLVQKIAGKDQEAFKELVRRYQVRVLNLCFRLTGNQENAEEAAQEVFFQVFRKAGKFKGRSSFSTWVYRIAVNRSLNTLRKSRRHTWLKNFSALWKNRSPGPEEIPALAHSPEKSFDRKEEAEFLHKALDSLPESQKAALILHHWEGLSCQEIAEILGSSIPSIESRIHRAKASLREKLLFRIKSASSPETGKPMRKGKE